MRYETVIPMAKTQGLNDLVQANQSKANASCTARADGSNWVNLTDEPRATGWPAWSPDGGQLAHVDMGGQHLLLVNANRSAALYLVSGVFGLPVWRL